MTEIFGVPTQALFGQLLIGLINGSFYALLSLAEILLAPLGISLVTRLAPRHKAAQAVGLWFAGSAVGNGLAAALGGNATRGGRLMEFFPGAFEREWERRRAMLTGPLVPTILSLAAPNVVNVSVQSLVLIADGWFVGKLGTTELAAMVSAVATAVETGTTKSRAWTPPGPGKYEIRDQMAPSLRSWIVVEPRAMASAYPDRKGDFAIELEPGTHKLRGYFNGEPVGQELDIVVTPFPAEQPLKAPLVVGGGK